MSVPLTNALSPAPRRTTAADVRIPVETLHVVVERLVHLERHRVPRLGAVDRDNGHAPVTLQQDSLATSVVTLDPPRSRSSVRRPIIPRVRGALRRADRDLWYKRPSWTEAARNVLLLALCQAAFISTAALMATIASPASEDDRRHQGGGADVGGLAEREEENVCGGVCRRGPLVPQAVRRNGAGYRG